MAQWANVHDLGVKGDGTTDDTAALQAAIDSHRTLYLPTGSYRIKATLHLRSDSVLIGFNPSTTVITPPENDPAFTGEGDAAPLVESARGGDAILSGIGIDTGNVAPRAASPLVVATIARSTSARADRSIPSGRRPPALIQVPARAALPPA